MNRKSLIESVKASHQKCIQILECKGQDYSLENDALLNYKDTEIVGITAEQYMLGRVIEKIRRISILLNKEPHTIGESVEDSILDSINILSFIKASLEEKKQSE